MVTYKSYFKRSEFEIITNQVNDCSRLSRQVVRVGFFFFFFLISSSSCGHASWFYFTASSPLNVMLLKFLQAK